MIDPNFIFMAVFVAGLACPAILLAYAFPRDKRLRVLGCLAGLLAGIGAAFLARGFIGFERPAGDLWGATCLIAAMVIFAASMVLLLWYLIEADRDF